MSKKQETWLHSFTVTETKRHKKGYTIYYITCVVIPRHAPEATQVISVWRRFKEVKQLYKDIKRKHSELKLKGTVPESKESSYFKRFVPEVIEARKAYILKLLDFIGDHPGLYQSQAFVKFFDSQTLIPAPTYDKVKTFSKSTSDLDFLDDLSDEEDLSHNSLLDSIISLDTTDSGSVAAEARALVSEMVKEVEKEEEEAEQELKIDYSDYIYEAALEFSKAVEGEASGNYELAFNDYKRGIELLLNGAKNDKNVERKKIAKIKVAKYLERAEDIYENFLAQQQEMDNLFLLSTRQSDDSSLDFEEISKNLERPPNYLSRFKVLKIVNSLLQVQDVTDKKVYLIKVIQKPILNRGSSSSSSRMIHLPHKTLYSVPLINYCQTEHSIFLVLKLICGGTLWNYIKNYSRDRKRDPKSLENIFVEPKTKIIPRKKDTEEPKEAPKVSIEDSLDPEEYTPSFDVLSSDMDVESLLQCSQKLLHSVETTLERTKEIEIDENVAEKALEAELNDYLSSADEDDVPLKEPQPSPTPSSPQPSLETQILPESIVTKYLAELVIAVDSLHAQGILCGDLNLDNCLLGPSGQLLLTYFYRNEDGIGGLNRRPLAEGYVAPERPLAKASDWWSVGVICFELLTERRFHLYHPDVIEQYFEVQFPIEVEISENARDLIEHLIEPDPVLRFSCAEIMAHEFFASIDWCELKRKGNICVN